ncbi:PIG-L family deacetylase [Chitinophaga agrisoli]|uniref:PIG-L family deacetylase n=1 Tax=Chitinophaga agrisoli TaxID=2607653 RepID=A0A5B2VRW7_9BACT|nr:PIG-L family deacetylase [Chitinophaga agrisoli]KAA2242493.1 PIG-L family deacetylase [Chitinophaga agrisoli]
MFVRISFTLAILLAQLQLWAQPSPAWNAADIKLQLKKLDTLGSILYMAAHPDDENTRLLGYLAKEKLYRTGYLSLTRGDGGQNLVGNEQGELLGLIRTQELLAARRIDGAEQFFTRAQDFGFSKNPQETFTIWDREKILGDAVWVIRNFKPDVIVARFPADSRAGHGHHTASAMLAAEAFAAAADPKRFPEQLKYVQPWQAKRLLWNTFSFGNVNTTSPDQYKIDVGAFNVLLGRGYGEIAAESRSQHKSQGFGVAASRGSSLEYFTTIAGDAPKQSLMDGVNTSWERVPGGKAIGDLVNKALAAYNLEDPSASIPALLTIRKAINALPDGYWKTQKAKEVDQLVLACAGLWVEAYSASPVVVPGQPMQANLQIINNSHVPVRLQNIRVLDKDSTVNQPLEYDQLMSFPQALTVPANESLSQPYWLAAQHPVGMYIIQDQQLVGRPENIPAIQATVRLEIGGQTFDVVRPLQYKHTDPVRGELYDPLVIAPPVVANLANQVFIFTEKKAQPVTVKLKTMADNSAGDIKLQLPAGFAATPASQPFNLNRKGDEMELQFQITPTEINGTNRVDTFTVAASVNGKVYTQSLQTIHYDHIPPITLFPLAAARLVRVHLQHNGNRLGYIAGAGDLVAASLRQVGYDVTALDEKDIMGGRLQQYDAIIMGVRAYNTNERLKYWQPRLMDYVKNGGTLLVQYNTNAPLVTSQLGPYPFSLSRGDRVTDEHAKITWLQPDNSVMHYPNTITPEDFDGWVQERGLYFTVDADKAYQKLFSMNDKGERPLDGSTLVADYGKGRYVYTSLAFFRQLPAGVPGAYRLFVNLISKQQ